MTRVNRYISGKELAKVMADLSETENTEGSSAHPQSKPTSIEKLSKASNQSLFDPKDFANRVVNIRVTYKEKNLDVLENEDFCSLCQEIILDQINHYREDSY